MIQVNPRCVGCRGPGRGAPVVARLIAEAVLVAGFQRGLGLTAGRAVGLAVDVGAVVDGLALHLRIVEPRMTGRGSGMRRASRCCWAAWHSTHRQRRWTCRPVSLNGTFRSMPIKRPHRMRRSIAACRRSHPFPDRLCAASSDRSQRSTSDSVRAAADIRKCCPTAAVQEKGPGFLRCSETDVYAKCLIPLLGEFAP